MIRIGLFRPRLVLDGELPELRLGLLAIAWCPGGLVDLVRRQSRSLSEAAEELRHRGRQ